MTSNEEHDRTQAAADDHPIPPPPLTPHVDPEVFPSPAPSPQPQQVKGAVPESPPRNLDHVSDSDNDAATATPEIPLAADPLVSPLPSVLNSPLRLSKEEIGTEKNTADGSDEQKKKDSADSAAHGHEDTDHLMKDADPQQSPENDTDRKLQEASDKLNSGTQPQPDETPSPQRQDASQKTAELPQPFKLNPSGDVIPEPTSEETRNDIEMRTDPVSSTQPSSEQLKLQSRSDNQHQPSQPPEDGLSQEQVLTKAEDQHTTNLKNPNPKNTQLEINKNRHTDTLVSRRRRRNGPARKVSSTILTDHTPPPRPQSTVKSSAESPVMISSQPARTSHQYDEDNDNTDDDDDEILPVVRSQPPTKSRAQSLSPPRAPITRTSNRTKRSGPPTRSRRYTEPVLPLINSRPRRMKKRARAPGKGERLTVLWPIDLIYYEGAIESILAYRGKKFYDIIYDSGEKEYYVDLSMRKWRFLDVPDDEQEHDLDIDDDDEEEEVDYTGFPKVDDRVMIMWHVDGKYYPGEVRDILTARDKLYYDVDYDGGDKEFFLDLNIRKWRFENTEDSTPRKKKKRKAPKNTRPPARPLPSSVKTPTLPSSPSFEPVTIPDSPSPPRSQYRVSRVSPVRGSEKKITRNKILRQPITTQTVRRSDRAAPLSPPLDDYEPFAASPSSPMLSSPEPIGNRRRQVEDEVMPEIDSPIIMQNPLKRQRLAESSSYKQQRLPPRKPRPPLATAFSQKPSSEPSRRPRTTVSAIVHVAGLVAKKWATEETQQMHANLDKLEDQIAQLRKFTEAQNEEEKKRTEQREKEEKELRDLPPPPELPQDEADVLMTSFRNNVVSLVKRYRTCVESRESTLKKRFSTLRDQLSTQNVNLMESGRILSKLDVKGLEALRDLEPTMRKRLDHPLPIKPVTPQRGQAIENTAAQSVSHHPAASSFLTDIPRNPDVTVPLGEPASAVTRNLRRKLADLVTRSDWLSDEVKRLRDREKELMKGNKEAVEELKAAKNAREEAEVAAQEAAAETAVMKKKVVPKKPPPATLKFLAQKGIVPKPVGITKSRTTVKKGKVAPTPTPTPTTSSSAPARSSGRANRKSLPRGPNKYRPPPAVPPKPPVIEIPPTPTPAPEPEIPSKPTTNDTQTQAIIPSIKEQEKAVKNFPAQLGRQMDRQASDLLALIATVWLLQDTKRSEPPQEYGTDLETWAKGCVYKCLRHSQTFLESSTGIMSARRNLRDEVDGEHIYTDWIHSDEEQFIENARENYLLWEPTLKDVEWRAEKGVIRGLNICLRKAMDLTSAGRFSATIMYAKAIIQRAIADFKQLVPGPIVDETVKPMTPEFRKKYEEALKPGWHGLNTTRSSISNITSVGDVKGSTVQKPSVSQTPSLAKPIAPRPQPLITIVPPAPIPPPLSPEKLVNGHVVAETAPKSAGPVPEATGKSTVTNSETQQKQNSIQPVTKSSTTQETPMESTPMEIDQPAEVPPKDTSVPQETIAIAHKDNDMTGKVNTSAAPEGSSGGTANPPASAPETTEIDVSCVPDEVHVGQKSTAESTLAKMSNTDLIQSDHVAGTDGTKLSEPQAEELHGKEDTTGKGTVADTAKVVEKQPAKATTEDPKVQINHPATALDLTDGQQSPNQLVGSSAKSTQQEESQAEKFLAPEQSDATPGSPATAFQVTDSEPTISGGKAEIASKRKTEPASSKASRAEQSATGSGNRTVRRGSNRIPGKKSASQVAKTKNKSPKEGTIRNAATTLPTSTGKRQTETTVRETPENQTQQIDSATTNLGRSALIANLQSQNLATVSAADENAETALEKITEAGVLQREVVPVVPSDQPTAPDVQKGSPSDQELPARKTPDRASQGKRQSPGKTTPQSNTRGSKGNRQSRTTKGNTAEGMRSQTQSNSQSRRKQVSNKEPVTLPARRVTRSRKSQPPHPIPTETPTSEQIPTSTAPVSAELMIISPTTQVNPSTTNAAHHQEQASTQRPWETSGPTSIGVSQETSTQLTLSTQAQSQTPGTSHLPQSSNPYRAAREETENMVTSSPLDPGFGPNTDSPIKGQDGYNQGGPRITNNLLDAGMISGKTLASKGVPPYSYASKSMANKSLSGNVAEKTFAHKAVAGKTLLGYDQRSTEFGSHTAMKGSADGTSGIGFTHSPVAPPRPRRVGQTSVFQATAKKHQVGYKRVPFPPLRRPVTRQTALSSSVRNSMGPIDGTSTGISGLETRLIPANQPFEGAMSHSVHAQKSITDHRESETVFGNDNQAAGYNSNMQAERGDITHMDPLNPPTPSQFPPLDGYNLNLGESSTLDMRGEQYIGVSSPINYANEMLQSTALQSPPHTQGLQSQQGLQGIGHLVNTRNDGNGPNLHPGRSKTTTHPSRYNRR